MRLICYLIPAIFYTFLSASAQSFSNTSGVAQTTAEAPKPATAEEAAPRPALVVNLEGTEKKAEEPVYDNSKGKVVSYKVVNGKVVFDNKRKILVSYDDFSVTRGMDNLVRCQMRIYILNDLTERINSLGIKLIWPEISTAINLIKVNPGVRTYRDIMLLGDGCFSMDKNPTIEVNRCRVKGQSEEECANAIEWFRPPSK